MKVVCDNCGAVYKVPDDKLVKPVNKATCRQCGHRMLIPRPRADQDPNERTLVTAVPPTPMGAPMRELTGAGGERRTAPIDDEPEKTLPGRPAPAGFARRSMARDDVPVFPGTPLPAGTRHSNPTGEVMRAAGDTVKSPDGSGPPDYPRRDSDYSRGGQTGGSMGLSNSDEPSLPPRLQQRPRTPPPAPRRAPPSQPEARRGSTPRPMVRNQPPPSISHSRADVGGYNPAGDLTIAMAGVFGTVAGIFILALLSVWPWRSVLWFGLAVSIGGAITALLILITGGRGTRPAWLGTSVVTGAILAVALATGIVSTHYVGERIIDLDLGQLARTIDFTPPPGVEPALPVEPEPMPEPAPEPEVAGGDPVMPDPVRPDPVRPDPRPSPTPTPRPTPDPRPVPQPTPRPTPLPGPAPMPMPQPMPQPMPPPAPDTSSSVSFDVIDVMLRNNLEVKRCFYEVIQTTGQTPGRVDVMFTLMPTGSATGVKIQQSQFANSPLEACLGTAIRQIAFPPSSGNGQRIVYPFVLQ